MLEHGRPRCEDGETLCDWIVAGLGKFGGIEMGFASDIELMLIYDQSGRTDGKQSISNAVFFDQLVNTVATGIRAPQDWNFFCRSSYATVLARLARGLLRSPTSKNTTLSVDLHGLMNDRRW